MRNWPSAPTAGDAILVAGVLTAAAALALSGPKEPLAAERVSVVVDGVVVHRLPLGEDRLVEVIGPAGTSVVAVDAGRARVLSSPCPQQVCVRRGWLHHHGDLAVCVPNHLVVRAEGRGIAPPFDGISR